MSTTPVSYEATIESVAALIRARTKDDNGQELGTFTSRTRPTDEQAQEAIDHAMLAIRQAVGKVGDPCADIARMAVAYGAAAEIELSYFPEQVRTDRSPYPFLIQRWQEALAGLKECVLGNLPPPGEDGGGLGGATIRVWSGVAWDYYHGDVGILGTLPPGVDNGNGNGDGEEVDMTTEEVQELIDAALTPEAWKPLPEGQVFPNRLGARFDPPPARYRRYLGRVELDGFTGVGGGRVAFTLPDGFRPLTPVYLPIIVPRGIEVTDPTSDPEMAVIDPTTGECAPFSPADFMWLLPLTGISFPLD